MVERRSRRMAGTLVVAGVLSLAGTAWGAMPTLLWMDYDPGGGTLV